VKTGQLGCPVCGRTFQLVDGVIDTGDGPPSAASQPNSSTLNAEGLSALIGISGPGGYLVLVGGLSELWKELSETNRGVGLVAVNPVPEVVDAPGISVIRSGRIPLKSRSMRGVVLSRPFADDTDWVKEAARVVLPGLRVVGEGSDPPADVIELMASAGGVWVGSIKRQGSRV
jgi:hypothetical protein